MRILGAVILTGLLSAGAAHAQVILRAVPPGVVVASDLDGPYDVEPPPRYAPRPYPPQSYGPPSYGPLSYGPTAYAPPVLPIHEVYRIVRESGYSPLGAPQQRGPVYTIGVLDMDGEDGRLVIDARDGRIVRFVPAYRMGSRGVGNFRTVYGPPSSLPPMAVTRPVAQARASVPIPKPRIIAARPLPEKSATLSAQPQATIPPAPTAAVAAASPAPTPPAARPVPTLQSTQAMPPAQGVE